MKNLQTFANIILIPSLLLNFGVIVFICVLVFTPLLDLPLAQYSQYKNCDKDYNAILKYIDNVPPDFRAQAKQLYAGVVCQRNSMNGQPLDQQQFNSLFQMLQQQATPTNIEAPAQ